MVGIEFVEDRETKEPATEYVPPSQERVPQIRTAADLRRDALQRDPVLIRWSSTMIRWTSGLESSSARCVRSRFLRQRRQPARFQQTRDGSQAE